jgi:hypothetical protein
VARLSPRRRVAVAAVTVAGGLSLALAIVLVVGRTGDDAARKPAPRAQSPARPAELVPMRARDRRLCHASRLLRPICPRRVPGALYPRRGAYLAPHGRGAERYDRFELIALPSRPGPPHLALFASRYGLDPVFSAPQRRLGRAMWGGRRGRLMLDRSRPEAGDHIVFRWSSGGVEYAVALAVWGTVRDAVATLRRIVAPGPVVG